MNSGTLLQLMSVLITAISTSGAVAAWFNRRNKIERSADLKRQDAERDNISAQAAATALEALRKELNAANTDLDRRRATIQGQEERIDSQQDQIRRLRRQVNDLKERSRLLESWVHQASTVMREGGMEPPPLPRMRRARTVDDDEGSDDEVDL